MSKKNIILVKFKSHFIAYPLALIMVGVGFFMRVVIVHFIGPGLSAYITFYPFVILAAIFGGLWPGLLVTVSSALIVDYWFLSPQRTFQLHNLADIVGMLLFIFMGILISVVVEFYHRNIKKEVKELSAAEAYNRSLLEASLDPLVTINREGNITDANEAAAKIRGMSKEKLIGTDFSNYFTEPEKARAGYQQVFDKGFVSDYPLTIRRNDGKLTDVLYNASVYRDSKGNVLGIFAAARDITNLNNAEQKLKESYDELEEKVRVRTQDLKNAGIAAGNVLEDLSDEKSRLERSQAKQGAILSSIGDGLLVTDEKGRVTFINKVAEGLFGRKSEEIIGKTFSGIYSVENEKGESIPFQKRPICMALAHSITKTTTIGDTYYYVLKDKTKFPVAITVTPIMLGEKVIGAIEIIRDITEEKRIERATQEARVKDEAILSSIGDGIIATDPNRKIIIMNKEAERLLGWKINEAIGRKYDEVVLLEDENGSFIPPEKKPLHRAFDSRVTTSATTAATIGGLYLFSKNKIKFPVSIIVSPVILNSKIIGAVEVFRDITKEKQIDTAKTEFVSLASHQLRTPLTAISWYSEMILHGDVGKVTPSQKKYLEEIYKGNQRMIGLVNTLLDVSRIEVGTFKIEPEPTNILALAQNVIDEQKPDIIKKRLTIIKKFSKDVPTLSTDPKLLRIVFQNLLSNSVDYTPEKGRIEFSISLDNKKNILIKVSDTGYGIPKDQQAQIFTKLFRADNVRDKDTTGTGLGLYIVKSIIENAGGKIWFESVENKGTQFFVTMPLSGMKKKEGTKGLE